MSYQERIKKLQQYLIEAGLAAFFISTRLNRQYVSGFTGSQGAVLVTKKGAELFVDDRYTIRARRESSLPIKPFSPITPLKRSGRIGIEDNISVREFNRLKQDYKKAKCVTTSNIIENLRSVKSAEEIRYIKKAQGIIDKIFAAVRKMPVASMTEIEVAQKMERLAIKL